jgi:hypothetical protein
MEPFELRSPSFPFALAFGRRGLPAGILPDAGFVVCVPGRRAPQYSSQTVSRVACGQSRWDRLVKTSFLQPLEGASTSTYAFWNLFLNRLSTALHNGRFLGPRVLNALK